MRIEKHENTIPDLSILSHIHLLSCMESQKKRKDRLMNLENLSQFFTALIVQARADLLKPFEQRGSLSLM